MLASFVQHSGMTSDPMTIRDIRAIIFDSDGTLVDSEVPAMDVLHEMAVAAGVKFTREEAHRQFRGVRMSDIAAWISSRLDNPPSNFDAEFTQKYRVASVERFKRDLMPMPGALELLKQLDIPFGVATNGPRDKVSLTLDLTGLLPYVGERIYSAYDSGYFKPDPALFLVAAKELGVEPRYCAVVEDSIPGLLAGIAAGMQVYSLHPRAGLPDDIVDKVHYIDSLLDLVEHL